MKKHFIFFTLISFLLLNSGCKQNPTEPEKPRLSVPPSLELNIDDISCTEAWIKVKKLNDTTFLPISVKINEKEFFHSFLAAADTVLFVDSLTPNTTYTVKGIILDTLQTAKELKVTTLPTTSHNFTWQTFTFGEHSSSTLYDVAIIDENNIWAVGAIYMKDSLGNTDPHAYNAVHWDGSKWKVKRIYYYGACSAVEYPPLKAVWTFSDSNIVITNGGSIGWFNGETVKLDCWVNPLLTGSINKMWGTNNSNLYVVGNGGNIAHYDGKSWQKIESGTTSIINDVWGIKDKVGNSILYCPVSSFFEPGDKKILKITNNKVDSFLWNKDLRLYSAWTDKENFLFVCGEGAFENKFGTWNQIALPEVGMNSVRGNNINDIFIVGDYGFISHFNGVNWKVISSPNDKGYSEVNIKDDLVVICGQNQGHGIIEIGNRN